MHSSTPNMLSSVSSGRPSDSSLTDGEEDIYMTIDTDNGAEFFAVEPPQALSKMESFQKEKQISVDPISLMGSTIRQASFRLVSPPTNGPGPGSGLGLGLNHPVPSPPPKLKFLSASLPGSAGSSPVSSSKGKGTGKPSSNAKSGLSRMQSAMDDAQLAAARQSESRRSRSLGGARLSNQVDEFDLWLEKPSSDSKGGSKANNPLPQHSVSRKQSKPPLGPNQHQMSNRSRDQGFPEDDKFKCGKLCLFLPRKGKPMRSGSLESLAHTASLVSQVSRAATEPAAISRTVSLERFECGSWSSIGEPNVEGEGESPNLFFDLPMELLRCSVSDMQSPVTAAFVFDDDNDSNNKINDATTTTTTTTGGVSKGVSSIRFSTSSAISGPSSPVVVKTPLYQAEDDFEAFLEAQAA